MAQAAHVVPEEPEASEEEEDDAEYEVERDAEGNLTGVHIANCYVDAGRNFVLRRNSMVMVQAAKGHNKFLAYVRELSEQQHQEEEEEGDIKLGVCWFYRSGDLEGVPPPKQRICRAALEGTRGGGDKGRFKEIFLSNHTDIIDVHSVMYPIKVWLLPSESLDPVTVPPEAGPLAAAAAAAGHAPLLPGFVCRRMYDTQNRELFPLSEVLSRRKQLGRWVVDDVAELLRRSEVERQECMREWVRKCQMRAARAGAEEGGVETAATATATAMDVG